MIGIDIVSIKRIVKIKKKYGNTFLSKIFNDDEIKLIKKDETLAGFFASKEAISKSLQVGIGSELSFKDIIIYKNHKNAPFFKLSPKAQKKFPIKQSSLSITHDGGFAISVAFCIIQ